MKKVDKLLEKYLIFPWIGKYSTKFVLQSFWFQGQGIST